MGEGGGRLHETEPNVQQYIKHYPSHSNPNPVLNNPYGLCGRKATLNSNPHTEKRRRSRRRSVTDLLLRNIKHVGGGVVQVLLGQLPSGAVHVDRFTGLAAQVGVEDLLSLGPPLLQEQEALMVNLTVLTSTLANPTTFNQDN